MEAHCTTPRELERARPFANRDPAATPRRGASPLAALVFGLGLLGLSGCNIVFPPGESDGCPSLEDMCPNLECDAGFLVNDEGCALCECAVGPKPQPTGCTSDADCDMGEMCVFGGSVPPSGPRNAGPAPTEPTEPAEDAGSAPGEPPAEDAGPAPMPPPPCDPDNDAFCGGGEDPDEPDEDRACEPNAEGNCTEERPEGDPPGGGGGFVAEEGTCVPVGCPLIGVVCPAGTHVEYDFSIDPCGDPRCVPDEPPPPPPPSECAIDQDCPAGLECQIIDECGSLCDPASNQPCPDVCVVIGVCVDPDPPPPPGCSEDVDCGVGFVCEVSQVCECSWEAADPAPPEDGGSGARPAPPCLEECYEVGQCVWNPENDTCYFDGDCGENQRCEYLDGCLIPPDCPNCLVACQGVCVDVEPEPVACMSDGDCSADEVCDLQNYCELPPGCSDDMACPPVCYGRCVAPEPVSAEKCLEQADCAEGFRCANEVDFCYCPEGETCDVCYWQCVPEDDTP